MRLNAPGHGARIFEAVEAPEKEREVIVLRELDPVFAQILPDSTQVSQLLQQFTGTPRMRMLKEVQARPEPLRGKAPGATSGEAQLRGRPGGRHLPAARRFLHRLETHRRFMAVPGLPLRSASRRRWRRRKSAHRVQMMDIETYIYAPSVEDTARIG